MPQKNLKKLKTPKINQILNELLDTPDGKTQFTHKTKIDKRHNYNYNLDELDNYYRYSTVVKDYSYMLPTDLAHLHSENIKGLKKLQDSYRSNPNEYDKTDIYNQLAEYHNILTLSQSVLKKNEEFIKREVKQLTDNNSFEDKINKYLKKLSNEKKEIHTVINKIKANNDMYAPTKSDYILYYNYNLKKLSFYESIYNEVLKRFKKHTQTPEDAGYFEVSASDEPASGEPANDEPANDEPDSGEPASGEPANGVPANDEPASGNHYNGEPASGEPASGEPANDELASGVPASGGNRRRSIRGRKHTKVTRRHKVTRTTRVIRKRKI
jgi:hypothetical protein